MCRWRSVFGPRRSFQEKRPPTWASRYLGLWGYFANDPASGEDAPSGPLCNRDGTVRHSWFDPVGWAGLDKTATPREEARHAERQRRTVRDRVAEKQRAPWV